MSRYFTCFEDSSISVSPATGLYALGGSADYLATPKIGLPPFKRRVLELSASANGGDWLFQWNTVPPFGVIGDADNGEFLTCVYRPSSNALDHVYILVMGQETGAAVTDGYKFSIDFSANIVRTYKRVASVSSNPFSDLAITHAAGEWWFYRFRFSNNITQTDLNIKTWQVGTVEPAAWGQSITDAASPISDPGFVGIGGYAASGTKTAQINFLSMIHTPAATVPVPIMNEDYNIWLRTPNYRRMLAELSAVGYDSGGPPYDKTIYTYIANGGYESKAWDNPPSQKYEMAIDGIPTFKEELSVALSGKVDTSIGILEIKDPASVLNGPGRRDDWLRMKWKRDYAKLYLGDPSWCKHDFRTFLLGRLGQPTASSVSKIQFPLYDLSEKLKYPISDDKFTSGPYTGQCKPIYLGQVSGASIVFINKGGQIEPPLTDENNFIYTIADDEIDPWYRSLNNYLICKNNQVQIISPNYSIVSVSGNEVTLNVDYHGITVNWLVRFGGSAPPAPLVVDTDYWVQSVPGNNKLTFSYTRGGAVIPLSNTTAGSQLMGWGYTVTSSPAPATIQLANNPGQGARITVGKVEHKITSDPTPGGCYINVLTRMGITDDFIDPFVTVDNFYMALWKDTSSHIALDVMGEIANGTRTWHHFTRDGLFQNGEIMLPTDIAGDPVMTFNQSTVKKMQLQSVRRPIDFSVAELRRNIWFLKGGPFQTGSQTALQGYTIDPVVSYGTPAAPLDNYPPLFDSEKEFKFDNLATADGPGTQYSITTLYKKLLGVFSFYTNLGAIRQDLHLGSLIRVRYPRLGWKQYDSGDPQSPDNSADFDATLAVLLGREINMSEKDSYKVKLTVFRQIPGYYPTTDLN